MRVLTLTLAALLLAGCAQSEVYSTADDKEIAARWTSGGDVNRAYVDCRQGEGALQQQEGTAANLRGCLMMIETTQAGELPETAASIFRAIIGLP